MEGISEKLLEIIDQIQGIAPDVWRIAYRQAIVSGIIDAVVAVVLLGVAVGLWRLGMKYKAMDEKPHAPWEDHDIAQMFCFAGVLSFGGFGLASLTFAVKALANPAWKAIELISTTLAGG